MTFFTASRRTPAAVVSPRNSSIICTEQIAASGLILFVPAYFGADPPMGSKIAVWPGSGLMLPPAATPMPPWIIAPRSVMTSPNMLSVTMTSKNSGFFTIHMHVASTWA